MAASAIVADPPKSSTKDQSALGALNAETVGNSTQRRHRYTRSSTTSVTQLLTDSCNSILQRFRRNPSERPEKKSNNNR